MPAMSRPSAACSRARARIQRRAHERAAVRDAARLRIRQHLRFGRRRLSVRRSTPRLVAARLRPRHACGARVSTRSATRNTAALMPSPSSMRDDDAGGERRRTPEPAKHEAQSCPTDSTRSRSDARRSLATADASSTWSALSRSPPKRAIASRRASSGAVPRATRYSDARLDMRADLDRSEIRDRAMLGAVGVKRRRTPARMPSPKESLSWLRRRRQQVRECFRIGDHGALSCDRRSRPAAVSRSTAHAGCCRTRPIRRR